MTGKNVTSTTMRTLGSSPNPNQITNSGAMATIGIVWLRHEQRLDRATNRLPAIERDGRRDREDHGQAAADDRLEQRRDEVADGVVAEVPERARARATAPAA